MNAWKKGLLGVGLLLSVGIASAACSNKYISVTISDELNESQQSESMTIQFVKGPRVSFNLTQKTPFQERKVKLRECDEYNYTINGKMKFLASDPEWKGASLPLRGKSSITLKDGDELVVWGDFSTTSVRTIDAILGPKNLMDQFTPMIEENDAPAEEAMPI